MSNIPIGRCSIAFLSPEVLQIILAYAVDKEQTDRSKHDGDVPWKHYRKNLALALVCRLWKSAAQREIYKKASVRDYRTWDDLFETVSDNFQLASYVQSLDFRVSLERNQQQPREWNVQDLSDLLQLFPRLTILRILLGAHDCGPGHKGDYSTLATLPKLLHLTLSSERFDRNLTSYRMILQKTPNIVSLTLHGYLNCSFDPLLKEEPIPVDLPALTRLSLVGDPFTGDFEQLRLLTGSTLDQIVNLRLASEKEATEGGMEGLRSFAPLPSQYHNAAGLLSRIGRQLLILDIGSFDTGEAPLPEIFTLCPNVKFLTAALHGNFSVFPGWVETLRLKIPHVTLNSPTLDSFFSAYLEDLKTDQILEILTYNESGLLIPSTFVKEACVARRICLIIDGIVVDLQDAEEAAKIRSV